MPENLKRRMLGLTGLEVTQLGFGTANSGEVGNDQAERVLNAVLDAGINFIDTAPDYDRSEERIGKYISHRRDEFLLATKCGCNIDSHGERLDPGHLWTADRLRQNIDQSLSRMMTDHVDVLQMHNPSVEEVEYGGLVWCPIPQPQLPSSSNRELERSAVWANGLLLKSFSARTRRLMVSVLSPTRATLALNSAEKLRRVPNKSVSSASAVGPT